MVQGMHSIARVALIFLFLLFEGPSLSLAQDARAALQTLVRSAQSALEAGDLARAEADFERARAVAPDNLEANRGLLLTYLEAGKLDQAEELGT